MYKVGAIIVTYNCDEKISDRIKLLDPQVTEILIIDNNSNDNVKRILKKISKEYTKIRIIFNNKNYGIACALNQGIKYYSQKKYDWIITLDHDSICEKNMISKIFNQYEKLPVSLKVHVAVLAPQIYDLNMDMFTYKVFNNKKYEIKKNIIQSGAIFKLDIFKDIGHFNEDLFIYYVDDEICERIEQQNSKIIMIKEAVLYHHEGEKTKRKLLYRHVVLNNYSGRSLYYIIRNSLYMYKKFKRKEYLMRCFNESVKVILFDIKKVPFIFRGGIDFVKGVKGAGEFNR